MKVTVKKLKDSFVLRYHSTNCNVHFPQKYAKCFLFQLWKVEQVHFLVLPKKTIVKFLYLFIRYVIIKLQVYTNGTGTVWLGSLFNGYCFRSCRTTIFHHLFQYFIVVDLSSFEINNVSKINYGKELLHLV